MKYEIDSETISEWKQILKVSSKDTWEPEAVAALIERVEEFEADQKNCYEHMTMITSLTAENDALKKRVEELELELHQVKMDYIFLNNDVEKSNKFKSLTAENAKMREAIEKSIEASSVREWGWQNILPECFASLEKK